MSWPAVAWAFRQQSPSSGAKFLLVMLADCASAEDWLAWPSVAYLSAAKQQDRKTVLANLQKLKQAQLIAPHGKKGQTGQIVIWKLPVIVPDKVPKAPKNGTLSSGQTVPGFPANSTAFPAKGSQKRDTEPVIDPVNEPKDKERVRATRAPRSPVKCSLPDGFAISPRVEAWAAEKGFTDLASHLEAFIGKAKAKGYQYADWDEAFMQAVRKDWAGLRVATKGKAPGSFEGVDYTAGVTNGRI